MNSDPVTPGFVQTLENLGAEIAGQPSQSGREKHNPLNDWYPVFQHCLLLRITRTTI